MDNCLLCNECNVKKCKCGYTECDSHESIQCIDCFCFICPYCTNDSLCHQKLYEGSDDEELDFCNDCYMNYRGY